MWIELWRAKMSVVLNEAIRDPLVETQSISCRMQKAILQFVLFKIEQLRD